MSYDNKEEDILSITLTIIDYLGESIESGFYFSRNFYIRREIWYQTNAKIECLHQKYEAFKLILEKIDNLMILSRNNVIKLENVDKFLDMLVDIQNNFSKELKYISPSKFQIRNVSSCFIFRSRTILDCIKSFLIFLRISKAIG